MEDLRNILLSPGDTILTALNVLVKNARQIALVVEDTDLLIGTVTDGDIRRGLLRQLALDSPVSTIVNRHPVTAPLGTSSEVCFRIMRDRGLRHLPIVDGAGRVRGLEVLGTLLKQIVRHNPVVILAGGRGRRLLPLTERLPKPMLPVGGKPLLAIIIENFAKQGFHDFFVSVNHLGEVIEQHFGDGSRSGVSITYLREDAPLGTAGALGLLPARDGPPVVVINGDIVTTMDFTQLLQFHDEQNADATMCVRSYDYEVPYGVVETDGSRLVGIAEKPVHRFFVNAGIYVLSPPVVGLVAAGEQLDMPDLFQRAVSASRRVVAFPVQEYWMDVGRLSDLEQAARDFPHVFG